MKRCVVYTRVSTANQADKDFNSCESQLSKMHAYIKSQDDLRFIHHYSDPGYTGSNLDRPGLKDLLMDVEKGLIDVILTYKIDRLTRSSKDFYNLIELFEKHNASYVSITEHFDTESPSGRLLRNIMLTFAQFEREMTAERTKDKMQERIKKGLWNGGNVPIGYKADAGKLVPDPDRAQIIKSTFDQFSESGSARHAFKHALSHGLTIPASQSPVSFSTIGHMLRNPVYIGRVRWSKQSYPGIHSPLISEDLFNKVQSQLKRKTRKKRTYKTFILKGGLIKCAVCGSTMTPTFTNKKERRYHYYKCVKVIKLGSNNCSLKQINAETLEAFIIDNLSRTADDSQYIENLSMKMAYQDGRRLGLELFDVWSKHYENSIRGTLKNFKNQIKNGSHVDRLKIIQNTIQKINLGENSLEVIINRQVMSADNDLSNTSPHAAEGCLAHKKTPHETSSHGVRYFEMAPRVGLEPTTR